MTDFSYVIEEARVREMINRGVTFGTARNYARSFDRWTEFLIFRGEIDIYMSAMELKDQISLLCLFMSSMARAGHPAEAELAGIRHGFRSAVMNTDIFHHPALLAAKRSLAPDPRAVSLLKEARKRIPIPYAVVEDIRNKLWVKGGEQADPLLARMTYLGIALGYAATLRVSEYAYDSNTKGKHSLRTDDLFFTDKASRVVVAHQVRFVDYPLEVAAVRIVVRSSKNGSKNVYLTKDSNLLEAQLIEDLLSWCKDSPMATEEMLFSRTRDGRVKKLTPRLVNEALKEHGIGLGLEEARVSSHGLRIGACTSMKAAGCDVEDVQECSGHASVSSAEIYMMSSQYDHNPLGVAAAGKGITVQDARGLLPRQDCIGGVQYKRIRRV